MKRPIFLRRKSSEQGYVLLVLLLMVSLLLIGLTVAFVPMKAQIERDHEDELIHRGVQYTRAIRRYTRKFGHYPISIDELLSSNKQRFLRHKYKDPITGKDFKLLHYADVPLSNGPGIAAYAAQSQNPANGPNGFSGQSPNTPGPGVNGLPPSNALAGSLTALAGANSGSPTDPQAGGQTPGNQPNGNGTATQAPADPNAGSSSSGSSSSSSQPTLFGGGAILGVASFSDKAGFHEFAHKSHYKDWRFYYDPSFDRGFPITGPTVPMTIPIGGPASAPGLTPAGQNPDKPAAPQGQQPNDPNQQQDPNQPQAQPQ